MALTAFVMGTLLGILIVVEGGRHAFYFFTGWKKIRVYLHTGGYHTGWARQKPGESWDITVWLHGEYTGASHLIDGYSPYREWLLESEVRDGRHCTGTSR